MRGNAHLIISDSHIPHHSERALNGFLAAVRLFQPERITFLGDMLDCNQTSRHREADAQADEIDYSISTLHQFVQDCRSSSPGVELTYIEGNHEANVTLYMKQHLNELGKLHENMLLPRLMHLEQLGIRWVPHITQSKDIVKVGPYALIHGSYARKNAGASVKAHLDELGTSCIIGHCHRKAHISQRQKLREEVLQGFEIGCTRSFDPHWSNICNWQLSFAVVWELPENRATVTLADFDCDRRYVGIGREMIRI